MTTHRDSDVLGKYTAPDSAAAVGEVVHRTNEIASAPIGHPAAEDASPNRFRIFWEDGDYYVSIPNYQGGEVVSAEVADKLQGRIDELEKAGRAAAQFVMWALSEGSWQGCDIDGGAAQDKAVQLGLIVETTYDPAIHGENDGGTEPGNSWFVPSEMLLSQLSQTQVEDNLTGASTSDDGNCPIESIPGNSA